MHFSRSKHRQDPDQLCLLARPASELIGTGFSPRYRAGEERDATPTIPKMERETQQTPAGGRLPGLPLDLVAEGCYRSPVLLIDISKIRARYHFSDREKGN